MKPILLDEHVEAFLLWEEARKKGLLKQSDVLLHVDSHDDFGYPSCLDESIYAIKDPRRFLEKNLTIATFIVPAALRGCFSTVYDMRPTNPPNPSLKQVTRDYDGSEKKRGGAETYDYYSWRDEGFLWHHNLTKHGKALARAVRRHTITYYLVYSLKQVPAKTPVILDVDMDFFSCQESELLQFQPKLTKRQIAEAKRFSTSDDSLKINLELLHLAKDGTLVEIGAYRNDSDQKDIYNDDPIWIEFAVRQFSADIKKRLQPKLISIARSVKTGYTPAKHKKLIEDALLAHLGSKSSVDETPPYRASFKLQNNIYYDSETHRIIKKHTLEEYELDSKADVVMWEMLWQGACFEDVIECLMKNFSFSRRKSEKELISNIWFLKREMVLK